MAMANSKWSEFISIEESANINEQLRTAELEKIRAQAIVDGTYITPGGCHVLGINAALQSQDSNGNWSVSTPATGWIPSDAACPKTHTHQPWAVSKVEEGTNLRWKYWGANWEVFGETFIWRNLVSVGSAPASIAKPIVKAANITITCTKGKRSKKVTAVKPSCPTGWKIKR
jgi:ribosomal protein L21